MKDLERLVDLARIVRAAFERVAEVHDYPSNLGGLCYDASTYLLRMARSQGIDVQLGHGVGHWFVLLGDTIVDVTSTQFGQPDRIAVLPLAEASKIGNWWELRERLGEIPHPAWSTSVVKTADEAVGILEEEASGAGAGEGAL